MITQGAVKRCDAILRKRRLALEEHNLGGDVNFICACSRNRLAVFQGERLLYDGTLTSTKYEGVMALFSFYY